MLLSYVVHAGCPLFSPVLCGSCQPSPQSSRNNIHYSYIQAEPTPHYTAILMYCCIRAVVFGIHRARDRNESGRPPVCLCVPYPRWKPRLHDIAKLAFNTDPQAFRPIMFQKPTALEKIRQLNQILCGLEASPSSL